MKHNLRRSLGLHKVQKCCGKMFYETHEEAELDLLRDLYRVVFS
ncbi:MAG: hypothetical protein DK304_001474 [Chloroflexi bacterium]|jgi:hypothetical protein|nr:MAG: hypothetical protein DK304_001474 [Chloroflexota bacterium]